MTARQTATTELSIMTSQERLDAYNMIVAGCQHIWSKNKIQEEKAKAALEALIPLTKKDPYFLAHLTSYIVKNSKAKDLKVFLSYVASLSSADGLPFSPGSKYSKPNLRYVGWAALHELDPKLVGRVLLLATRKFGVKDYLNVATHFPTSLRLAVDKYIRFRELNPNAMEGIKKAGFKNTFEYLARQRHYDLSNEARKILNWPRKGQKFEKKEPLFKGMSNLEIAEKIREEKLPYIGILAELSKVGKKLTPVVAVALLEQATGDQAVIMTGTFQDAGILEDAEVRALYDSKIREAKTALDRIDNIKKIAEDAGEELKSSIQSARAEKNKQILGNIGKVFVHLDFSGSMQGVREYAGDRGAIIAEMVQNPEENFAWGWFSDHGVLLEKPEAFERDAFKARLFGQGDFQGTDCLALYGEARRFGADIDVFLTDQGHGAGSIAVRIKEFHARNPEIPKPKACVIIDFNPSGWYKANSVKEGYEANSIPVAIMSPDSLTETALVAEAVKSAMIGPVTLVDEIMDTPLIELPKYYYVIE